MRAVTMAGFGGPEVVEVAEVPEPEPGPNEVVVRIEAAALNHLDLWTAGGLVKDLPLPHVLGADGAGVIAATGPGARLKEGARVLINPALSCGGCERCRAGEQSECSSFAMLGEHRPGTFAELVVVPERNCFPYPKHLSPAQAAALGTTFITAYRMLFRRARLTPGEWVLITGIGGGLALSALQLARPVAGRVFVTSSSDDKLERARALGADHTVNYRSDDPGVAVRRLTGKRGVDIVIDSAGGDSLDASLRALRKGGRLVTAGATAGAESKVNLRRVFWNQLSIVGSTMGSDADVSDMLRAVAGMRVEPVIDSTYPLAEARAALERLAAGEHFGKIVLVP